MLLLLAVTGFVKAQINETFEAGTTPLGWTAADGKFLGTVDNPKANKVNSSAKCAGYVKSDQHEYSLLIATMPTALNLTTNNRFTVQVFANRNTESKFIFKLEGSKGAKEFTKKIVVTKAWQEYTFDFSSLAANDSIKKILFFFDPGVKNSKDTFYFDNIKQLPADACAGTVAPTTMNLLDDFECQRNASYSVGWDSLSVVDNPSKTGINTSSKVGKVNDTAGEGSEYYPLIHHNVDPLNLETFNFLRLKVIAPKAGLVLLKLEGGTSKEFGTQITADQVGKWVEVSGDFSSVKFGNNTKLVLFFNAGVNGVAGDVYYIDDIRFTEKPALEDFETTPKLTWAPLNNDNALHGTFASAANPAPASLVNSSPNVGKYTKGTATISTLTGALPTGFVLTADAPQLSFMVYAPDAGKAVQVQLVSATKGNISGSATVTAANTWEEVKFDFTAAVGVTDISQIRVFFDPSAAAQGKMYFFDNLQSGKLTINACLGITPKLTIMDDFECQRNATYANNPPLTAIANPKPGVGNPSDKVGEYKDPKDEWSALTIDNGANTFDFSRNNQLSVKIWSPKIVPILFKLEGGSSPQHENPIVNVTTAESWITYKIDFSNQKGKNHKKLSIFLNAGVAHTTDDVYYIDDIEWKSEPITGCAVDFETPITFTYFANKELDGKNPDIVANPKKAGLNTSNKVLEFNRQPGAEVFAGMFADLPAAMKWTNNKIVIRAKVLMDHIGNFAAKLEGSPSGPNNVEIFKANTKVNEWEEITIDFTGKVTGSEGYTRLTIFFDLTLPVATTAVKSYLDDIVIGDGAGCGTTGIFDPIVVEKLSIFPNPASTELTVNNTQKVKRFVITNMLGQNVQTLVFSTALGNQTISIQNLEKGMYILSAFDEKGIIANSRFVKE